jgi:hypothetical protein
MKQCLTQSAVCNVSDFAIIHLSRKLAPNVTIGGMLQGKYFEESSGSWHHVICVFAPILSKSRNLIKHFDCYTWITLFCLFHLFLRKAFLHHVICVFAPILSKSRNLMKHFDCYIWITLFCLFRLLLRKAFLRWNSDIITQFRKTCSATCYGDHSKSWDVAGSNYKHGDSAKLLNSTYLKSVIVTNIHVTQLCHY